MRSLHVVRRESKLATKGHGATADARYACNPCSRPTRSKGIRAPRASIECDADAFVLAPNDVAGFAQPVALDAEHETVRIPKRADDFHGGARRGDVADRTWKRVAAELDGPGFEDAVTRRNAMVFHRRTIDDPGPGQHVGFETCFSAREPDRFRRDQSENRSRPLITA